MKIKSSNKSYDNMEVNNYKDCFHAFMVEGAVFDGYYDIPFIPQNSSFEINNLIPYVETLNHTYKNGDVVHFYLDDYRFDGPKGIWNGITSRINSKRSFDLSRFNGVSAIISQIFHYIWICQKQCKYGMYIGVGQSGIIYQRLASTLYQMLDGQMMRAIHSHLMEFMKGK